MQFKCYHLLQILTKPVLEGEGNLGSPEEAAISLSLLIPKGTYGRFKLLDPVTLKVFKALEKSLLSTLSVHKCFMRANVHVTFLCGLLFLV